MGVRAPKVTTGDGSCCCGPIGCCPDGGTPADTLYATVDSDCPYIDAVVVTMTRVTNPPDIPPNAEMYWFGSAGISGCEGWTEIQCAIGCYKYNSGPPDFEDVYSWVAGLGAPEFFDCGVAPNAVVTDCSPFSATLTGVGPCTQVADCCNGFTYSLTITE